MSSWKKRTNDLFCFQSEKKPNSFPIPSACRRDKPEASSFTAKKFASAKDRPIKTNVPVLKQTCQYVPPKTTRQTIPVIQTERKKSQFPSEVKRKFALRKQIIEQKKLSNECILKAAFTDFISPPSSNSWKIKKDNVKPKSQGAFRRYESPNSDLQFTRDLYSTVDMKWMGKMKCIGNLSLSTTSFNRLKGTLSTVKEEDEDDYRGTAAEEWNIL